MELTQGQPRVIYTAELLHAHQSFTSMNTSHCCNLVKQFTQSYHFKFSSKLLIVVVVVVVVFKVTGPQLCRIPNAVFI